MTLAFDLTEDSLDQLAAKVAARLGSLKTDEPEPWINADQAAEYLGASDRRRIYELVKQGRIPFTKDGVRLLFRRSEIDSALKSGRMGVT